MSEISLLSLEFPVSTLTIPHSNLSPIALITNGCSLFLIVKGLLHLNGKRVPEDHMAGRSRPGSRAQFSFVMSPAAQHIAYLQFPSPYLETSLGEWKSPLNDP